MGVNQPHTGHIAKMKLIYVRQFKLPEKRDETCYRHYRDKHWVYLLNINIFLRYSLNDRQVYSKIENGEQVYTQPNHRQCEKEHDSMRIFPELSEKVRFVNHISSNGDPA